MSGSSNIHRADVHFTKSLQNFWGGKRTFLFTPGEGLLMQLPKGTQRAGLGLRLPLVLAARVAAAVARPRPGLPDLAAARAGLPARLPNATCTGRRGLHARLTLRAVR